MDQLALRSDPIEVPSPDQFRRYQAGPIAFEVNGAEVTAVDYALAATRALHEVATALRDLIAATGRLASGDHSSDVLFGVLDMRTRACTTLGIDPGAGA